MTRRDERSVDRAIHDAMVASVGGLDLDTMHRMFGEAQAALQGQITALANAQYSTMEPEKIARALAHTAKTLDMLYRLSQFAKGQPNSRREIFGDLARVLTDKELAEMLRRTSMPADELTAYR